jgi:hypothetical protein
MDVVGSAILHGFMSQKTVIVTGSFTGINLLTAKFHVVLKY